ncbi:Fc.00g067040.m01.CDS01 [Cosmosporella sp. VM-42]
MIDPKLLLPTMSSRPPTSPFSSSQAGHSTSLPPSDPDSSWTSMSSDGLPQASTDHNASTPSRTFEKHPKGRRKRTSAKDKMILEEAYSSNDKPDKQARLEIVKRVDLNEKEVQIWFQNRRQNDRRRSRPLSQAEIQEIAAKQYSARYAIPPPEPLSNQTPNQPKQSCPLPPDSAVAGVADPAVSSSPLPPYDPFTSPSLPRTHSGIVHETPVSASQESIPRDIPETTPKHPEPSPSQEAQGGPHSWSNSILSSSSSIGYFANRRNLGSSFSTPSTLGRGADDSLKDAIDIARNTQAFLADPSHRLIAPFPSSTCSPETSQAANHSQSQSSVRLSLSLEGKAELVRNQASPTPNPPLRPSSTPVFTHERQRSFERSYSDLDDLTLPPIKGSDATRPPRLMRVRSRDVQAWESCADADTRDQLTTQAEHESNGSAIAAINLLRSSSSVLQLNMNKRNAPMPSKPQQSKRAKISRASSSIGRLETYSPKDEEPEKDSTGKIKISRLLSPTDSDKENWSPGEDGNPQPHHPRPLPMNTSPKSHNSRRRPLRGGTPNFLGSRALTAPARHRGAADEGIEIFEDSPTGAPEIERFISGGQVSPSKKPDMDCAAGLLSLARGGWNSRQASSSS